MIKKCFFNCISFYPQIEDDDLWSIPSSRIIFVFGPDTPKYGTEKKYMRTSKKWCINPLTIDIPIVEKPGNQYAL